LCASYSDEPRDIEPEKVKTGYPKPDNTSLKEENEEKNANKINRYIFPPTAQKLQDIKKSMPK